MTRSVPPLIGITADVADPASNGKFADSCLVLPQRYLVAIERAGAVPVVLPNQPGIANIRRILEMIDGLVLSGGDFDIHPRYYREKPIEQLGTIKPRRTEFELEIADAAMNRNLPVLGICGGAQAINVALGGSLYQDIAAELGHTGVVEHTSRNPQRGHAVRIKPGTKLSQILRRARVTVNTSHHQSVKKLGRGLLVNAVADDGVIEGIESTRHLFVLGVQWHPEVLARHHQAQRRLLYAFVQSCKNYLRPR
jgi:putative glutamine amidotransferase